MYKYIPALFSALIAAALFAPAPASAGGQLHRMPVAAQQPQPAYRLELVSAPRAGQPIVVALRDADGRQIGGGDVEMVHAVWRGPKAIPMYQRVPVSLPRDGEGHYVCNDRHQAGETVLLRGAGPADAAPVWLTVTVGG